MKNALISRGEGKYTGWRVAQVSDAVFEVSLPFFFWVDASDDATAETHFYEPSSGQVLPFPLPTPEQLAIQAKAAQEAADAQAAREDAAIAAIAAMTPAQAAAYVENNVTNLAEAKAVLKTMAKAICVLARRI